MIEQKRIMESIEAAIADIKAGKMIILIDDEDRENEGDLCMAADLVTPEAVNFMAKYGRGLICLSLTPERVNYLNLHMMSAENTSSFGTAFTVSIEARKGVTTGISAKDRAKTILTAIDPKSKPEDLARPGHVFPLRARPGGVLQRAGQTEGSVDLARLAGLTPAGVICEIMNDDGSMSRVPELKIFAETHNLKIVTIEDLIKYRLRNDRLIHRVAEVKLPTDYGDFNAIAYESMVDKSVHMALVKGDLHSTEPMLVRVHSECLTGMCLAQSGAIAEINFIARWSR